MGHTVDQLRQPSTTNSGKSSILHWAVGPHQNMEHVLSTVEICEWCLSFAGNTVWYKAAGHLFLAGTARSLISTVSRMSSTHPHAQINLCWQSRKALRHILGVEAMKGDLLITGMMDIGRSAFRCSWLQLGSLLLPLECQHSVRATSTCMCNKILNKHGILKSCAQIMWEGDGKQRITREWPIGATFIVVLTIHCCSYRITWHMLLGPNHSPIARLKSTPHWAATKTNESFPMVTGYTSLTYLLYRIETFWFIQELSQQLENRAWRRANCARGSFVGTYLIVYRTLCDVFFFSPIYEFLSLVVQ